MAATVDQEKCAGCGVVLVAPADPQARVPCPACGSMVRGIQVFVTDGVELHDAVRFKHKRPGYKRPIAEGFSGDDFFHKEAKWVQKEWFIDRPGNRIWKKITDPTTGRVIHYCDEPLDRHTGHGSAKPKGTP